MDSGDITPEKFSEALFTYLWFTENLVSASTAAETAGELTEFVIEVAKAVVLLSSLSVQSFYSSMEEHFEKHGMLRRSVFTFLASSCFNIHDTLDDIFMVILETLSYTYQLVVYCQGKGYFEYFKMASMCWCEVFDTKLKKDFYDKGGWASFQEYVYEYAYVPKDADMNEDYFLGFLQAMDCLFPRVDAQDTGKDRYPDLVTAEKRMEMRHKLDRVFYQPNNDNAMQKQQEDTATELISPTESTNKQHNYLVQLVHASIVSLRALAMPSDSNKTE